MDDFVQATGTMMRTKAGEISVRVTDFKLLAKSLSPLPVIKQKVLDDGTVEEFGEFSDVETRYRQRYADLAVNGDVRDVFVKRAQTIRALRDFFDSRGFLEVETPILQPIYGGAAARPFTTHHNQLHQDLFLRISFELYLKRLLVGGIDAVYEIGRDFRNEGVSFKHNTEFTMLEFYKAYIDYKGVMELTEQMVAHCAQAVLGTTKFALSGLRTRRDAAVEAHHHPRRGQSRDRHRLHGLSRRRRRSKRRFALDDAEVKLAPESDVGQAGRAPARRVRRTQADPADDHHGLPARHFALRQARRR